MDGGSLLTMNTNYVCSSFDKIWQSLLWFDDHLGWLISTLEKMTIEIFLSITIKSWRKKYQVHIQGKVSYRTQGINHKWTNRNVWDKTTIHHIHMDPITARQLNCFHLGKVTTNSLHYENQEYNSIKLTNC